MHLAPIDEIEHALPSLPQILERRNLGNALEVACRKVDDHRKLLDRLEQILITADLLAEHLHGAQREAVISDLKSLWSIGEVGVNAETKDNLDDFGRQVTPLKDKISKIERFLLEAWQQRTKAEFAAADTLGLVLKEISEGESLKEIGEMMLHASQQGMECGKRLPTTINDRQKFNNALEERDAAYALLKDSGADTDVINFLNSVALNQATLNNVTIPVYTWLSDRNATLRFKVVL